MSTEKLIAKLSSDFNESLELDMHALNRARGKRLMIAQSFQPTVNFIFDLIEEFSRADETIFVEHDGKTERLDGALIINYFFGRQNDRFTLNFRVFEGAIEIDDQQFPVGAQDDLNYYVGHKILAALKSAV